MAWGRTGNVPTWGHLGVPADHPSHTHLPYGGRAVSDASPGSLRGCRVAITTKRPWWHCGQRSMSMPVRRRITVAADSRGNTGGAGCAQQAAACRQLRGPTPIA